MVQIKKWADVRMAVVEAGVTLKAVELEAGFGPGILGRIIGFDPTGKPSDGKRVIIELAIATAIEQEAK